MAWPVPTSRNATTPDRIVAYREHGVSARHGWPSRRICQDDREGHPPTGPSSPRRRTPSPAAPPSRSPAVVTAHDADQHVAAHRERRSTPGNRRIYLSLSGDAAAAAESSPRSAAARHSLPSPSSRSPRSRAPTLRSASARRGRAQARAWSPLPRPRFIKQQAVGQLIAGCTWSVACLPQLALVMPAALVPAAPVPLAPLAPPAPPVTVLY
jgi:hypothetical protein